MPPVAALPRTETDFERFGPRTQDAAAGCVAAGAAVTPLAPQAAGAASGGVVDQTAAVDNLRRGSTEGAEPEADDDIAAAVGVAAEAAVAADAADAPAPRSRRSARSSRRSAPTPPGVQACPTGEAADPAVTADPADAPGPAGCRVPREGAAGQGDGGLDDRGFPSRDSDHAENREAAPLGLPAGPTGPAVSPGPAVAADGGIAIERDAR